MQHETFELMKRRAHLLAERHQAEDIGDIDRAIELGWQAIDLSQKIMERQHAGERLDIGMLDWRMWQAVH